MTKSMIYVSADVVSRVMSTVEAIPIVEESFGEYALGKAHMPPKIYLNPPGKGGDFRAMPAFIESSGACGIKWVNVHANNIHRGIPSVMAMIILNDAETGEPISVMDGTLITSMRTGAAGGVAARHLAKSDASVVALVGCGAQAVTQWDAVCAVREIREARVWGHESGLAEAFIAKVRREGVKFIVAETVKDCVSHADIVITTTPVRKPLVLREWIAPGTHINAIGADAVGKEELDPGILNDAVVVVDDIEQSSHSGEINVPLHEGSYKREQIAATIGEVVAGLKKGRKTREDVTVFDSTGLAIQDMAVAWRVYTICRDQKLGQILER